MPDGQTRHIISDTSQSEDAGYVTTETGAYLTDELGNRLLWTAQGPDSEIIAIAGTRRQRIAADD